MHYTTTFAVDIMQDQDIHMKNKKLFLVSHFNRMMFRKLSEKELRSKACYALLGLREDRSGSLLFPHESSDTTSIRMVHSEVL